MTEKFCKDCPCWTNQMTATEVDIYRHQPLFRLSNLEMKWCDLNPEWRLTKKDHYCTVGRERMVFEQLKKLAEVADQRIQETFEVKE